MWISKLRCPTWLLRPKRLIWNFITKTTFGKTSIPDAYERLLLDALQGDASLFTRSDGIETAWELMDPILKAWEANDGGALESYPAGSDGPKAADELLAELGHSWLKGCVHD